ncbi:unnamed protein product [Pneumocystis jirovecii]|uniref:Asparagine-rich protein n=2 Tax=Pneumocystis jirovecii TaxID=42068 RepID=L0PEV7_PNEJI|nr:uncharacterized protein T551_00640 [Pneumocystis jirovecii RU7]KTW31958.1 hypothetical protein T551_00640 [Pneumocystis jirovecii RU7]CCJ30911.1 unnamed protein product [Pneumocystis jirovecii]
MPLPESLDAILIVHGLTCHEYGIGGSKETSELIELSWILVDLRTLEEQYKEDLLVRPINTPLTNFSGFVTLSWEHIQSAGTFHDAIHQFVTFIQEKLIFNNKDFVFAAFDAKKLTVQFPREARDKSIVLPSYLLHPRVYDLYSEYRRWQSYHPEVPLYSSSSIVNIRKILETDINGPSQPLQQTFHAPHENPSRRAKDECLDLLYILKSLVKKSKIIDKYPNIFSRLLDVRSNIKAFLAERSCILYMIGLPHDTTQSELESWFTQHGGHPIAFWTLRTPDYYKPTGTGFVVFSSHEEAIKNLMMNGKTLNDKVIEISPSSSRVLERAAEILIPFPSSKNKPRPGDWNCPFCGFSNFQRRTACFRCSFSTYSVNMNNDPMITYSYPSYGGNMSLTSSVSNPDTLLHSYPLTLRTSTQGGNVPFRAGDWKCRTEGCGYHNFAKNTICLKCGANKNISVATTDHNNSLPTVTSQASQQPITNPLNFHFPNPKHFTHLPPIQKIPLNTIHGNFNGPSIPTSFSLKQPQVSTNNETVIQNNENIINKEKIIANTNNEKQTNDWHCTSCFFVNFKHRSTCLLCGSAVLNLSTPVSNINSTASNIQERNQNTLECFNENMASGLLHEDLKALIIDDDKSVMEIKKDAPSKLALLSLDS